MNTRAFEISGDNGSVIIFDDGSYIDTVAGDRYLTEHLPQFDDINDVIDWDNVLDWVNENAVWDDDLPDEWWQDTPDGCLSGIEGLREYVGA
jgi:hypothetical protein